VAARAGSALLPFFPSDVLLHYAEAFVEVYGVWGTPPCQGPCGRVPKPRRSSPPDLCSAVVVKERTHSRVVHLTTRIVYRTTAQVAAALRMSPVSRAINPKGIKGPIRSGSQ
jgi:hypothetical protein